MNQLLPSVLIFLMLNSPASASEYTCDKLESDSLNVAPLHQSFYKALTSETDPAQWKLAMENLIPYQVSYRQVRSSTGILLVDLRPASGIDFVQIPNAVSMTRQRLLTSRSLKKQHLVLIDDIYRLPDLYSLIIRLQALGFEKVQVLSDGVVGWRAASAKIAGSHVLGAIAISPEQLWSTIDKFGWVVADIDSGEHVEQSENIVKIELSKMKGIAAVEKRVADRSKLEGRHAGILLVDRNGSLQSEVYKHLSEQLKPYAHYLIGGVENYYRVKARNEKINGATTVTTAEKVSCLGAK